MKIVQVLFALVIAMSASTGFADDLSPLEQKREILVVATLLLDAAQTLDIKRHPELRELNPILGSHPSDVKIVSYFVLTGIGHYVITKELPVEYRAAWQYGWAVAEIATVIRNRKLNLRFNF